MDKPDLQDLYICAVGKSLEYDPPRTPPQEGLQSVVPALWTDGRMAEALAGIKLLERRGVLQANERAIRGFWRLDKNEISEALEDFAEVLRISPSHEWGRIGYAHALFLSEEYEAAAVEFQNLIDSNTTLQGPHRMVRVARLCASGSFEEIKRLGLAAELAPLPDLPPGMNYTMQIRRVNGALEALKYAINESASIENPNNLPLLRLALELAIETNQNDLAESLWQFLDSQDPYHGLTAMYGGFVLARTGQWEDSHQAFVFASQTAPLEAGAWGGVGGGLRNMGDLAGAEKALRVALFLDDTRTPLWTTLGKVLREKEDHQAAYECYATAAKLAPDSFGIHAEGGFAAILAGLDFEALRHFAIALDISPEAPQASQIYELVSSGSADDRRLVWDQDIPRSSVDRQS